MGKVAWKAKRRKALVLRGFTGLKSSSSACYQCLRPALIDTDLVPHQKHRYCRGCLSLILHAEWQNEKEHNSFAEWLFSKPTTYTDDEPKSFGDAADIAWIFSEVARETQIWREAKRRRDASLMQLRLVSEYRINHSGDPLRHLKRISMWLVRRSGSEANVMPEAYRIEQLPQSERRAEVRRIRLDIYRAAHRPRRELPRKLDLERAREIRAAYSRGDGSFMALGKKYGVSGAMISMVINHAVYREPVERPA